MRACALAAVAAVLLLAGCGSTATTEPPRTDEPEQGLEPNQRVVTLGAGDRARIPAAGVTCKASQAGGAENLHCTRIGGGREAVVFYRDSVVVRKGPDNADSYSWRGRPAPRVYPSRRRVFTLHAEEAGELGDRLNAPAAATTCTVMHAGGGSELSCMPIGGGRYRFSLSRQLILVWDVAVGQEAPVAEYRWGPR